MSQTERELKSEIYDMKQRLRNMVEMNAEQQQRIAELEAALGRVFKEAVAYGR